jgi:hypothetical protein
MEAGQAATGKRGKSSVPPREVPVVGPADIRPPGVQVTK